MSVIALSILTGCEKPYAFDRPLGLTSRLIKLTHYEGSTHIIVYSSGNWNCSLRNAVSWAELSVVNPGSIGDMLFSYSQNDGINRKVIIDLSCGAATDSIVIAQAGTNTNPQLAFVDEIITAPGNAGIINVPIVSNVMNSLDQIQPLARYYSYGEPGPVVPIDGNGWIKSCRIENNIVYLELTGNATGEKRTADFMLRLNNDLDIDFTVTTRIRQNTI